MVGLLFRNLFRDRGDRYQITPLPVCLFVMGHGTHVTSHTRPVSPFPHYLLKIDRSGELPPSWTLPKTSYVSSNSDWCLTSLTKGPLDLPSSTKDKNDGHFVTGQTGGNCGVVDPLTFVRSLPSPKTPQRQDSVS